MNDYNWNNKVVQSNDLVQLSRFKMGTIPMKIFKVLVSCIDTHNPNPNNTVYISKQDLRKAIGESNHKDYNHIRRQTKKLQQEIIDIDYNDKVISVSICPEIVWPKAHSDDLIECTFSNRLMPYLINLQERFLQYDVGVVEQFKSKYSLSLYEYLLSRERQERNLNHTYSVSVSDLRWITNTTDKVLVMKDFRRRVVDQGCNGINNAHAEFLVEYKALSNGELAKSGKKITHFQFTLRRRTSHTERDFDIIEKPQYLNQPI